MLNVVNQREGDVALAALTVSSLFVLPIVDIQFRNETRELVEEIIIAGAASEGITLSSNEVDRIADQVMGTSERLNSTTKNEIIGALAVWRRDGDGLSTVARVALLLLLLRAVFSKRRKQAQIAAEGVVVSAYNAGAYEGALKTSKLTKTWISQRDSRVRVEHRTLDGDTVQITEPFTVQGIDIRFPGDPLAPPHLTINCRCFLRFGATL